MNEITRTDWRALPAGYLSPTQVWSYIQCPACYEAERILKIPKPVSADLMIGRFAHAALANMRQLIPLMDAAKDPVTDDLAFQTALTVGSDTFDSVITEQVDVDEDGECLPVEIEL